MHTFIHNNNANTLLVMSGYYLKLLCIPLMQTYYYTTEKSWGKQRKSAAGMVARSKDSSSTRENIDTILADITYITTSLKVVAVY